MSGRKPAWRREGGRGGGAQATCRRSVQTWQEAGPGAGPAGRPVGLAVLPSTNEEHVLCPENRTRNLDYGAALRSCDIAVWLRL